MANYKHCQLCHGPNLSHLMHRHSNALSGSLYWPNISSLQWFSENKICHKTRYSSVHAYIHLYCLQRIYISECYFRQTHNYRTVLTFQTMNTSRQHFVWSGSFDRYHLKDMLVAHICAYFYCITVLELEVFKRQICLFFEDCLP